jgi:hypothetical protein
MSDHATSRSTSPNAIVATDAPRARRIAPTSVPATWLRQAQASLTDWYRRLRDRDELARLEPRKGCQDKRQLHLNKIELNNDLS